MIGFLFGCFRTPFFWAIFAGFLLTANSSSQETNDSLAAKVGKSVISVDHVDRELAKTVGQLKLSPEQSKRAWQATLKRLIDQQVVFDFLRQFQTEADLNDARLELENLESELKAVEKTLESHLTQSKQTLSELKFDFAWKIAWKKFVEKKLTDAVLEAHFDKHKRKFDETELRVAHLLLKRGTSNESEPKTLQEKTKNIWLELENGADWTATVAKHSEAESRDSGGEIGWIKINGPMPKSFTQAAFGLNQGQISQPVETNFGFHIIKCLEVKSAKLGWRDAYDAVKLDAARAMFQAIVKRHKDNVNVEYGETTDSTIDTGK